MADSEGVLAEGLGWVAAILPAQGHEIIAGGKAAGGHLEDDDPDAVSLARAKAGAGQDLGPGRRLETYGIGGMLVRL